MNYIGSKYSLLDFLETSIKQVISAEDKVFCDLFAGTGAVGIEAVSRGAVFVVFVEHHKPTSRLIAENLELLEIADGVRVIEAEALSAIAKLESERAAPFDFVFVDPPYASAHDYHKTLHTLGKSPLLGESSTLIAEHRKTFTLPAFLGRLEQFRILKQGDAALTFYRVTAMPEQ